MKLFRLFLLVSVMLAVFACAKQDLYLPDTVLTDLTITETTSPATNPANQPIVTQVKMQGPNQCYRFSHFQVAQLNPLLYQINARATIPNPDKSNTPCLQT